MPPQPAASLFGTIEHHSGNPRVETFPGAACCRTSGSAKIFRTVIRGVWQQSKAAPLHGRLAAFLSRKPQDLGDKASRASLFRLQEENQGVKLWG
jgi:hypothetical protein